MLHRAISVITAIMMVILLCAVMSIYEEIDKLKLSYEDKADCCEN
jgi:hypothetical protein